MQAKVRAIAACWKVVRCLAIKFLKNVPSQKIREPSKCRAVYLREMGRLRRNWLMWVTLSIIGISFVTEHQRISCLIQRSLRLIGVGETEGEKAFSDVHRDWSCVTQRCQEDALLSGTPLPFSAVARFKFDENFKSSSVPPDLTAVKLNQDTASASTARRGCRSTTEPGCKVCCVSTLSGCMRFYSSSRMEPYYDGYVKSENACNSNCKPCASCTKSDEELLSRYAHRQDCDCQQPPGLDPCFYEHSCGCYCQRLRPLLMACPIQPGERN
jgi:hypothetical protein